MTPRHITNRVPVKRHFVGRGLYRKVGAFNEASEEGHI